MTIIHKYLQLGMFFVSVCKDLHVRIVLLIDSNVVLRFKVCLNQKPSANEKKKKRHQWLIYLPVNRIKCRMGYSSLCSSRVGNAKQDYSELR